MTTKAEVQRQLEDRMREFKSHIDHRNHKIEQSSEPAHKALPQSQDTLNAHAEQQLSELNDANEAVWDTVANDIETYWGAFTGANNDVFLDTNGTKN